jgi:PAS domain S-box-containing protein
MKKSLIRINQSNVLAYALPTVLIFILLAMRLIEGYLLFHSVVELIAVIEGILIAVISYYMYPFTRNNLLLFLGIGFFWVASLDLFHMLTYHGMNLYENTSSYNTPATLWVFTRILEIATILAAPFIRFEKISTNAFFIIIGAVSVGIYAGTFMNLFPVMYATGTGLTPTKIAIEYGVIIFDLIGLLVYRYKRNDMNQVMYRMIRLSLIFGILAESCFTLYTDFYGISNFAGHIFKFLSYWMIFQGVVVTALKEPFSVMAKASSSYDSIPVPIVILDSEGTVRQVNRAAELCSNRTTEEILGNYNHDVLHPQDVSKTECPICRAIEKGEYANVYSTFSEQYKQYTLSPIKTNGIITGTLQICTDMTEQKTVESALQREKETVQNYLDIAGAMILVLDIHGNVKLLNRRGCEIIGYSLSEVIGKNWIENFIPERLRGEIINVFSHSGSFDSIEYYENAVLMKNGEERLIAWRNQPLLDNEGLFSGVLSSGEDITEIRHAQIELKEGKEFYQTMFASLSEAVFILQGNTIIDCNESAVHLFENDKSSLLGLDFLDAVSDIECKQHTFDYYLDSAHKGKYKTAECSLRLHAKPNESKIVELTLSKFGREEENKLIVVARDTTKQVEEEKLFIMQTRQAQMGEMISMIAHQWRQPLAIINAIVSQMHLKAMLNGDEEGSEYLENLKKIEAQSVHLSQTITDYRDFFRPDKPKEYFNASSLLDNALSLIDHTLKSHSIDIQKSTVRDAMLYTYRNELLQVLIVMLKNSFDMFIENNMGQGRIVIGIDCDDNYCTISIYDNAGGIPTEVMKKLFVPYFTTKDLSHGTGLGLYMSRVIIHEHCHGTIDVYSQGVETIFKINLPYVKEE